MNPRDRGFVLPLIAALLSAAALLAGDGLRGAAMDQALAGASRERQRGFEAAEIGLVRAQVSLQAGGPAAATDRLSVDDASRVLVTTELIVAADPPAGFSSGKVVAQRLRVRSEGETRSGARVALEAGFTRLEPLP
jgi:Tfp pilus assembly protein PilX